MSKAHDPDTCFCGDDEHSAPDTFVPCPCPCDECMTRTNRVKRWMGIEVLAKRLMNGGVDPEVLADLIWAVNENAIEERIRKEVRLEVKRLLKGVKLQSEIWGTSLDFET